ncbi:hypothetical protein OSB04_002014 [Centaurea solstitialis]|uniref:Uncharacterized protein n=1 Tax=Centaurea solstitialis TaxID=347529 RepID=A0AA38UAR7_9ASTR|nr:hypothetical protein OSB04_002014 [Centaurea solstitialis]
MSSPVVVDNILALALKDSSSKLNRLCLTQYCHGVTGYGLSNSLKRLPHLETLELSFLDIRKEEIEVIGRTCPLLKSFQWSLWGGDVYAHAIAKSMPALRHLTLVGIMDDAGGVQAILNGCPHLESLDLRLCAYLDHDGNIEKMCKERIKDFKYNPDNVRKANEDSDVDAFYDDDDDDDDDALGEANEDSEMDGFSDDDDLGDYGVSSGSDVSAGDDYDCYWL